MLPRAINLGGAILGEIKFRNGSEEAPRRRLHLRRRGRPFPSLTRGKSREEPRLSLVDSLLHRDYRVRDPSRCKHDGTKLLVRVGGAKLAGSFEVLCYSRARNRDAVKQDKFFATLLVI